MQQVKQSRTAELTKQQTNPSALRYARVWWVLPAMIPALAGLVASLLFTPTTAWSPWRSVPVAAPFAWLALGMACVAMGMLAWRVILVARYRPHSTLSDDALPHITVIIPAYNEGEQVAATIRSVLASDYPKDRLTVVAVNDGSADDTSHWIRAAAADAPDRVKAISYDRNRGKRYALNRGFSVSEGSVVITVDSDSEVAPDALRQLASPFADPRIGAVAGSVRVLNTTQGAIPRMLDVAFTYSFDFIRASQSAVNTVFCTPGALSAYRRDLVLRVRAEWLNQTFMGRPAAIGEDRAMTNLILREGFNVVFQGNAVVYTEVPTRLPQLSRMLLRWARSNLRESIITARFIFRRFRADPMAGGRVMFLFDVAVLLWLTVFAVPAVLLTLLQPMGALVLAGAVVVGSLPSAVVFALLHTPRRAGWAFAYGLFSVAALSWIKPYAAATVWRNGWLTRTLLSPSFDASRASTTSLDFVASADVERTADGRPMSLSDGSLTPR